MSSVSASVVTKLVTRTFPDTQNFHGLMNEYFDLMVEAMDALVEYMKDGNAEKAKQAREIKKRSDEIRVRNIEILSATSAPPTARVDFIRIIINLDMLISGATMTSREIDALEVEPDRLMLEIAVAFQTGARLLREGFRLLKTNLAAAEKNARAARKAEREIESIYRHAESKLYRDDEMLEKLIPGKPYSKAKGKAMQAVLEMMRRREIYRNLSKTANHLAWAADQLHDIAENEYQRTATNTPNQR